MNPDSDSSRNTSKSVDLTNLDSMDYGCKIHLLHHTCKEMGASGGAVRGLRQKYLYNKILLDYILVKYC